MFDGGNGRRVVFQSLEFSRAVEHVVSHFADLCSVVIKSRGINFIFLDGQIVNNERIFFFKHKNSRLSARRFRACRNDDFTLEIRRNSAERIEENYSSHIALISRERFFFSADLYRQIAVKILESRAVERNVRGQTDKPTPRIAVAVVLTSAIAQRGDVNFREVRCGFKRIFINVKFNLVRDDDRAESRSRGDNKHMFLFDLRAGRNALSEKRIRQKNEITIAERRYVYRRFDAVNQKLIVIPRVVGDGFIRFYIHEISARAVLLYGGFDFADDFRNARNDVSVARNVENRIFFDDNLIENRACGNFERNRFPFGDVRRSDREINDIVGTPSAGFDFSFYAVDNNAGLLNGSVAMFRPCRARFKPEKISVQRYTVIRNGNFRKFAVRFCRHRGIVKPRRAETCARR